MVEQYMHTPVGLVRAREGAWVRYSDYVILETKLAKATKVIEPEDDEPKTWQELAEAAIADLRRYAHDEIPARRLASVETYEERAARLSALTAGKLDAKKIWHSAFDDRPRPHGRRR